MTAKEIGKALKIFPNAVYKSTQPLLELGLVEKVSRYPVRFQAQQLTVAIQSYSSIINQNLQEIVGHIPRSSSIQSDLSLNFIRTRKERLELIYRDTAQTRDAINLIASGLEVPAEAILAYKKAIDRGVKIRIIVQNLDEVKAEMYNNWKKIGVEVRYFPGIQARIYTFDHNTLYLSSYDSKDKKETIGVRFTYAPVAKLMDELFEQRWKLAKEIKRPL